MRKRVFALLVLLSVTAALPVTAQTTAIISDTSIVKWGPSADNSLTFGTPPVQKVTSYEAKIYVKSVVTACVPQPTCLPTEPASVPFVTVDFGKPPVVAGEQGSQVLKPFLQPDAEYYLFLRAKGPGGVSPSVAAAAPFGFPSAPRAVTSAVTFTP